ncbi:MAG: hypothetical protein CVU39_07360 [Chloroflexi bacterium HGW-Chloroflexi-10]|nr:MAG: hypothetical protein CVU39_07360 [Chloroflexi bacterium HGW-Chloroflexi-10]
MPKLKRKISKKQNILHKRNQLPLFLALGGIAVLLIAAFFAFQKKATPYTPEVSGTPSLKVDKERVDLGEVKLGQTVQVSFGLKNVGDQPLKFSDVPYVEVKEGC